MMQAIRALLQFTTILPLGKTAPFDSFAHNTWLYPLAGYVIGGFGACVFLFPGPSMVQAVIAMGVIVLVTGANHFDGLLDLGDGLMAHGSQERRREALTDRQIGTGAVCLGMIILFMSIAALSSFHASLTALSALVLAEVGGKWCMAVMTVWGRPFHEGIHAFLYEKARKWFVIPATSLLIPAFLLPLPLQARFSAACVLVLIPMVMLVVARRLFGGVNGDVTGASGEITRAAVLAVVAWVCG